jgi:hypothetical protein
MNAKLSALIAAAAPLILLGCTTQPPAPPPAWVAPYASGVRVPHHRGEEFKGQLCQVGTSCLSLDPRPFELCLLSTRHCSEKAMESLLAEAPLILAPPQVESP